MKFVLCQQLDSLKEDMLKQPQPPSNNQKSATTKEISLCSNKAISNQDILKELREIKKQNSRTHWLLSVMIGLTLAWQLSEVSAILILKEGLTHPLRSIGNMISGIFKFGDSLSEQELEKDAANNKSQAPQIYSYPGLKSPEIPHAE
ncbi:hypothetical protein LIER_41960 [Lithospermum erythrorhizon]|uniref:Uncharacterized protein n=1 Tax=Lithospermum erythrorhizon TaxID=34254 RepID=A0AAV3RH23_LITER